MAITRVHGRMVTDGSIGTDDLDGSSVSTGFSGVTKTDNGDGTLDIIFTAVGGATYTIVTPDLTGPTGAAGGAGATGSAGATGAQGPAGPTGPTGPAGTSGITVTGFSSTSNNDYTETITLTFSDSSTHSFTSQNLRGATGATGSTGNTGATGTSITGISLTDNGNGTYNIVHSMSAGSNITVTSPNLTGPTGATGPQGATGNTGPQGTQGIQGETGATGATGATGPSGPMANIVEDTTPQLGGNLDVNGQNIVSVSDGNIDILPNGSGKVNIDGDGSSGGVVISDGLIDVKTGSGTIAKISLYCESSNLHAQTIQPQPHSANVTNTLTLPAGSDQELVGTSATQTLTNKSIAATQLTGALPAIDASQLTNLPASGGVATLVSDGAITAGKPCILTAAGKAKQIAETGNNVTGGTGTDNSFNGSNAINYVSTSLAKVADDKVAVAYRDASNSNYGVVRVATVNDSGRTIAFGTAVVVNSVTSNGIGVAYDTSRSVLGVTVQTESDPKLIIANYTISGTALTKQGSSLTLISSDEVKAHTALFDPDNNHIMVFLVYVNGSDRTFRAVAVTGNASGTPTSSYLVNVNVDTTFFDVTNPFFATYDTNVNAFFVTSNKSEPSTFRAVVVTNSGSAITATERSKTKPTNYKEKPAICFDSNNNKVVMAYNTTSNYNEIVNITMTANDFTLGTPTAVTSLGTGVSDSVSAGFASFDPTAQRVVILRGGGGAATSRWAVFSNDGTDFTQQSTGVWDSSTNNFAQRGGILQTAMTTNMTSNPIPIVMSNGNTGYAYSAVFTVGQSPVTNLDNNYIGLASSTVSDGQNVDINLPVGSINSSQSSLSIGEDYFTDNAGTVRTFVSGGNALSGGQYLGEAISATSLLLKDTPTDIIFGKADSNISKGRSVLVEADGDFKQIAGTTSSGSETTTSYMEVHSTSGDVFGIASDGAGTMCVVFRGTSNYIQVSKGTLNADHSISWATPVTMASVYGNSCSVYYDKTNSLFVANFQSYNDWHAYRVTGSGNTTTVANTRSSGGYGVGSGVNHQVSVYSDSQSCGVTLLSKSTGKIGLHKASEVAASGNGYRGMSGEIGGSAQDVQFIGMDYDQTTDVGVAWWRAESNSDYPTVRAFTVDGSTTYGDVTLGTAVVLESTGTNAYGGVALNGTEGLAVWKVSGTELRQNSFTLSGTTITKGTAGALPNVNSEEYYVEGTQLLTYNPKSDRYYFAYNNSNDNYDVMLKELQNSSGTVSVTNTIKVFDASNNQNYYWNVKYVGNTTSGRENQQAYMLMLGKEHGDDAGTFGYAPAYTSSTSNLTTENFIGFAEANATANGTSKVRIHGINPNLTGLTPGQTLYVTANGDLSETAESGTVVEAGKAISTTQLLIRG
tara:strand:+ start:16781 stop:20908 length:4128 start_codon:yes stop_codon:yes gene_type:complete